jgi:hypothetical protein
MDQFFYDFFGAWRPLLCLELFWFAYFMKLE